MYRAQHRYEQHARGLSSQHRYKTTADGQLCILLCKVSRGSRYTGLRVRPRALVHEPVNSTDRKIEAFLRGGRPRFRCATCVTRAREKNRTKKNKLQGITPFFFRVRARLTLGRRSASLSVASRSADKPRTDAAGTRR